MTTLTTAVEASCAAMALVLATTLYGPLSDATGITLFAASTTSTGYAASMFAGLVVLLTLRLAWRRRRQGGAADASADAQTAEADPRWQILEFFQPGDKDGPRGLQDPQQRIHHPGPSAAGKRSEFFSVWRPTSDDAIRMMMEGRATGKGLNVKGKSAKQGVLSGFVPFLQIHDEADKRKVGTSPPYARLRLYFASELLRDAALAALRPIRDEMVAVARAADEALDAEAAAGVELPSAEHLRHVTNLKYKMEDPSLTPLDGRAGCWGLEVPERLMMEAYVARRDISPPPGWETGRASEPDYMDMNLMSTRKVDPDQPMVVVYQHDARDAMNPRGLLVAYEENGRVLPVASDFDAFLFGSRGIDYPAVPQKDTRFVHSMLSHIEDVLKTPDARTWTHRWLDVLKGRVQTARGGDAAGKAGSFIAGSLGTKRQDGRLGFGDAITQSIIHNLVHHSSVVHCHGAVRHAAENVNYYFPQELDPEFLVLWHGYDPASEASSVQTHRRYLTPEELRGFLVDRVAEGYVFPLNPAWILRDAGWYEVYEALRASPACQPALDAWLPPESGLRERIEAIHQAYPQGFARTATAPLAAGQHHEGGGVPPAPRSPRTPNAPWGRLRGVRKMVDGYRGSTTPRVSDRPGEEAYERAHLALQRHYALRRAKLKTKAILLWAAAQKDTSFANLVRGVPLSASKKAMRRSLLAAKLSHQVSGGSDAGSSP